MKKNRFPVFVFCQLFGKDHRDKSEEHGQKKKIHLVYFTVQLHTCIPGVESESVIFLKGQCHEIF
jgi:hypothetical protein